MARDMEAGLDLPSAYANQEPSLPPLYRALIRAGTSSGDVAVVLDEIARHAGERAAVRDRLHRALLHPLLSAFVVLAIGVVVLAVLGPQVSRLDGGPGFWTAFVGGRRDRVVELLFAWGPHVLALGCAVAVLAALLFAWVKGPLDGSPGLRGPLFRLPLLGEIRASAARVGFASTLALLLRRGVALPEALTLTAEACEDARVRAVVHGMRERAEGGAGLVASIAAGGLLSPGLLVFVEAGEKAGTAELGLTDVASVYQRRLERAVDRLCALVGPVAMTALGVLVLWFAVLYLEPVYRTFSGFFGW